MPASLTFKKQDQVTNATAVNEIKTIVYEDSTGNKYTFGVDNATNVFNTFKYDPNGADPEVDYSATATKFMTGGAVAALLGIGTNVGEIKTKTDKITDTLGADVIAIKAKTDTIPADLTAKVTAIETATNAAHLGDKLTAINTKTDFIPDTFTADVTAIKAKTDKMPADLGTELASLAKSSDVTAIKAKTDKMPADLNAELGKLTVIGNAISNNGNVTEAAKAVLESSFKKAIETAGEDGSNWLEKTVKEIVSQPSFDIPTSADAALNWTW